MALDGITLRAITEELKDKLIGGRIQKIYQINSHLVILNIYNKDNFKLLISTNPQNPRIHLTKENFDNPIKAPQFSMILRKHLQNAQIENISQIGLDRTIEITVDTKDEMGFPIKNKLIIDIMGKYSNLVLTNSQYKVIESIKRISHEMSSVRAVYPGTKFEFLNDNKINILDSNFDLFSIDIDDNIQTRKIFYTYFTGFGPQIGYHLSYISDINFTDKWKDVTKKKELNTNFLNIVENIKNKKFNPTIYIKNELPSEYYAFNLDYIDGDKIEKESISEVLDYYYVHNVNDNSLNQAKDNLIKSVQSNLSKQITKLANLEADLVISKEYEYHRIEGDLLSAESYKLSKGMTEVEVYNYYTNENIKISLNPKKSPWENIEEKYKKSKKLHKSYNLLQESIPQTKENIEYLKSIISQIDISEDLGDIESIKEELIEQGLIKRSSKQNKSKQSVSKPLKFRTSNNNLIYVGKNNKQNEEITLREANPEDIFLHIKNLPGAHVLLKSTYQIKDFEIEIAAFLAAKYSKNSNEKYIDVDYTQKKNVRKAKGAKLGMVYYTDFKTIRVNLEDVPEGIIKIE